MRMSRLMMLVAAGCLVAGSMIEAQGRGNRPAGRGPQIARAGNGGSKVGVGRAGGGKGGNAGATPGKPGKGGGNAGRGGRGNGDDDQDKGGGRRRGGSDRDDRASFVAKMNPKLRARLEPMLPSGMTLEQAADGFRNQGQFTAALQQSRNHDISFVDLKAVMTGDNPLSLGQAMRKLGAATKGD
jgi:hypothetical protein